MLNIYFYIQQGASPNQYSQTGTNNDFSDQTQRLYEEQNDREIDSLGSKISSLKHIAIDIGREVQHHNSILEGMDSQMGSVGNLMGGALTKLNDMMKAGGSKHMCYLIMLIVGMFMFLYLLLSWR